MSKFTKGPWHVVPMVSAYQIHVYPYQEAMQICRTSNKLNASKDQNMNQELANARLIAAAPAMYEVLEAVEEHLGHYIRIFESAFPNAKSLPKMKKEHVDIKAVLASAGGGE